jgi:sarcosine oxidase subunit alpha
MTPVPSRSSGYRLSSGGSIDRSRPLQFTFDGRRMSGYAGDTLASALIANGVRIVGRSLKYHRPRGFMGAGLEDPNGLLAVRDGYGRSPAVRAGEVLLAEGLEARTVTGWPSAQFDLGAVAQAAAAVLGAGFYHKTFMWPAWSWYEPLIKRSTGFGRIRPGPDGRRRLHRHDVADVLIVGGGPAALAAARALLVSGLRVVLADDQPELGGCLAWENGDVEGLPGAVWVRQLALRLRADETFEVLTATTVSGAYEGNFFTLVQRCHDDGGVRTERFWKLRARHVVLASGSIDRPIVFQNNDRPGIMLGAAVRRFIGQYAVAPADRLAVFTNNDSGHLTALDARRAGIEVAALIDSRPRAAALHANETESLGIRCLFEAEIADTQGYQGLKGITVAPREGPTVAVACSGLAVSGGWLPLVHLAAQRGIRPRYDAERSVFLCDSPPAGWHVVGGAAGALMLDEAIKQGHRAAEAIAAAEQRRVSAAAPEATVTHSFGSVTPLWRSRTGKSRKMWVDHQNDVKASDVEAAAQENYVSVEHLKRFTTLGMGTDQGRTSNVNGLALLADVTGCEIGRVGTTTFRPPYEATRMSAIAHHRQGDLYRPRRHLPAEASLRAAGAEFRDFGWERPDWFRSNGEDREAAVATEMAAVRHGVGVFDSSPLGKIEVTGPDAADFLNRFYVSNLLTLKPGRARYSVMLRDDGIILDDGVVTCIAENHYLAGPTSDRAETVAAWFERWRQIEWPAMRVAVTPVTSNWAAIAIAGPKARDLLQTLEPDFDVSGEGLPHMHFREGSIGGVPARVARVSFTGELQYEITVSARWGRALLDRLMANGTALDARHVGMEAWLRLRLEKGYIHLGTDTNGRTTADDIGMGGLAAKKAQDFIGKRSLTLAYNRDPGREQLVGLKAIGEALEVGGRILAPDETAVPCRTEGYVTSACHSPALGKSIGMALIERGLARQGETVRVFCSGRVVEAEICTPSFYDPNNDRLKA